MAAKRNLLLCFDAFGTLYRPKAPIEQQYAEAALQVGLHLDPDRIRPSFRRALAKASAEHPNYGCRSQLGPVQWWTDVVTDTLTPLLPPDTALPSHLAPRLLRRFATAEAYTLAPRLAYLIGFLQQKEEQIPRKLYDRIVLGVISNSDDRVGDILTSFGLSVRPLRYTAAGSLPVVAPKLKRRPEDIQFVCMSYDVGTTKPGPAVFEAAEQLFAKAVHARMLRNKIRRPQPDEAAIQGFYESGLFPSDSWDRLYVGDDYATDVAGALAAGWHPVLVQDRWDLEGEGGAVEGEMRKGETDHPELPSLEQCPRRPLLEVFSQHRAVQAASLVSVVAWLTGANIPDKVKGQ